ncbi:MAG: VTT domain-containing protein [Candidatus Korobacteraceae bacterium]|jgi:membrane protein YqaA with SNARE-associated domain
MLIDFVQKTTRKSSTSFALTLRHLGVFGLFSLAIVDSLPFPTFGGPDILIAILAARHHSPWYELSVATTAGSLLGAFITFKLARQAGYVYLDKHFGKERVQTISRLFEKWGTGALAVSAAVPFPTPTSVFFAAAGASKYPMRKYLIVVGLCRAARYSLIAILADHYGRHFVRAVRHPGQYWGWLLLFAAVIACAVAGGIVISKRLETSSSAG